MRKPAVTLVTPKGTTLKVVGTREQCGFVGRVQQVFEHEGRLIVELYHTARGGMYMVDASRCRPFR